MDYKSEEEFWELRTPECGLETGLLRAVKIKRELMTTHLVFLCTL